MRAAVRPKSVLRPYSKILNTSGVILLAIGCFVAPITALSQTPTHVAEPHSPESIQQSSVPEEEVDCLGIPNGTAVDLGCGCDLPGPGECGKCNCPVPKDCLGVPHGSAIDLGCGCDLPGPGECGECECRECRYFPVEVTNISRPDDMQGARQYNGREMFSGEGQHLACIQKIVEECNSDGKMHNWLIEPDPDAYLTDDCVARTFQQQAGASGSDVKTEFSKIGPRGNYEQKRIFVMDENCQRVTDFDESLICGDLKLSYMSTPISLLWDSDSSIADHLTYTQFPVNPTRSGRWFSWHASGKTPLLVYDKYNTGRITSAAQLFGNWSVIDAPSSASFSPISLKGFSPKIPWKSGFDALAQLDQNGDGELRNQELTSIALWFDLNTNGISDPGEVRQLNQVGVTALYYKNQRREASTGNIYVSVGYERVRNGVVEYGTSVDWMSSSFSTKLSAAAHYYSSLTPTTSTHNLQTDSRAKTSIESKEPATKKITPTDPIGGAWIWSNTKNPGGKSPSGLLTLQIHNDSITGHSYIEYPLKRNNDEIKSYVVTYPLKGKVIDRREHGLTIEFEVTDGETSIAHSSATLSFSTNALTGHTKTDRSGSSFEYDWIALRRN